MLSNLLSPARIIALLIILFIAFPVHELAHALTADFFGDLTPRMNGRLTINPLAHLDWIGSLLLVVAGFGWAKPVPINPYVLSRRSPAAVMWVSLAGPVSNLVMAIIAAIPFRLGLLNINTNVSMFIANVLYTFITINLFLCLFNLIPIAPLDGEKILGYFFPPSWNQALASVGQYGPMILMAVVFLGPLVGINLLGIIINPPVSFLLKILTGVSA